MAFLEMAPHQGMKLPPADTAQLFQHIQDEFLLDRVKH